MTACYIYLNLQLFPIECIRSFVFIATLYFKSCPYWINSGLLLNIHGIGSSQGGSQLFNEDQLFSNPFH